MDLDSLLHTLERMPGRTYGYVGIAATVGPLLLRIMGFKALGNLIRPLALLVLVGGAYAKQQQLLGKAREFTGGDGATTMPTGGYSG